MNILAIIITYYPEKELLKKNVLAYKDYVNKILIWENTPDHIKQEYRFVKFEKIEYVGDGINSISHGLNYAWQYAKDNDYDYILTMDQDSVFVNFGKFLKTSISFCCSGNVIIGPQIVRDEKYEQSSEIAEIDENSHLITSGMLLPVPFLNKVGGYCEDFNIDAVDVDICVRARIIGAKLFKNCNGVLIQRLGEPYVGYLLGKQYVGAGYGEKRLYEIFRNHIIVYRRYKAIPVKGIIKGYLKSYIFRIMMFENHKLEKIKAIFCGIKDGLMFKV